MPNSKLRSEENNKTANYDDKQKILNDIRRVNRVLVKKGIVAIPVRYSDHRVLIYVYRPSFLEKDFCDRDTAILLSELGYEVSDVTSCVRCLSRKLINLASSKDFPHEIGLFLGYPPEDVDGFINRKDECKFCGHWKVYGDVESAKCCFARYRKCTDLYYRQWQKGKDIERLTIAV